MDDVTESDLLRSVSRALIGFNKRAERTSDQILGATFVDSAPLFDLLATPNNQVIYGRRGTGKTHALKYLAQYVERAGHRPIYVDLRSIGSNGSIYSDGSRPLHERALTLILDVLQALHEELYSVALEAVESAPHPEQITARLDDLSNSLTTVRVTGSLEEEAQQNASATSTSTGSLKGSLATSPSAEVNASASDTLMSGSTYRVKRAGTPTLHLNFGTIASALNSLLAVIGIERLWVLMDEWSEVPIDLQPYLADLLRRTILPISGITLKIAAIEHRTHFAILKEKGEYVGLELGADLSADLNLDDFLVFDNNQDKSTEFFSALLFRHYVSSEGSSNAIDSPDRLVRTLFTQRPAFEEFVRAVEGVPRDALNLAAKIATKAFGDRVSINHVRQAARDWYQQDKQAVIRENQELNSLLTRIVDDIIGKRKARAFLFPSNVRDPRIEQLFDSRLLHVRKKNISAKDQPGMRYDAYKIDYGCYVDLINTSKAPQTFLSVGGDEQEYADVPRDDYRSIRRAILTPGDLDVPF